MKADAKKAARSYLRDKLADRRGCDIHEIVDGDDDIFEEIVAELAVEFTKFAALSAVSGAK